MEEIEYEEPNIVLGNVAIAKFMGWKIDNSFPDKGRVWRLKGAIELDTTFKFHESWSALIPVVEALMPFEKGYYCYGLFQWFDMYGACGLEDTWGLVVKRIKTLETN